MAYWEAVVLTVVPTGELADMTVAEATLGLEGPVVEEEGAGEATEVGEVEEVSVAEEEEEEDLGGEDEVGPDLEATSEEEAEDSEVSI